MVPICHIVSRAGEIHKDRGSAYSVEAAFLQIYNENVPMQCVYHSTYSAVCSMHWSHQSMCMIQFTGIWSTSQYAVYSDTHR